MMAAPLHCLLRKGIEWSWGADQEHAYAELKDSCVLSKFSDAEIPLYLMCSPLIGHNVAWKLY